MMTKKNTNTNHSDKIEFFKDEELDLFDAMGITVEAIHELCHRNDIETLTIKGNKYTIVFKDGVVAQGDIY